MILFKSGMKKQEALVSSLLRAFKLENYIYSYNPREIIP